VGGVSLRRPTTEGEEIVPVPVNVENFVRAETDRMFAAFVADAGGVNLLNHNRTPTPVDRQTVIRMNRDTLYSIAVVDVSEGAAVTLPDTGGRYVSVMVVSEDHHVDRVLHVPGVHELRRADHGTQWVAVAARILVDPSDPDDVAVVNALQDGLAIEAAAATPFTAPDYDAEGLDATRAALLELARGLRGFDRAFGAKGDVDPIRHLIGTAAGWGGLPASEATYVGVEPDGHEGAFALTVRDVPVDGFWSISVYNADGYFEPNDRGAYSVNDLTAARDADGSVTVHFGGCGDGRPNCIPIMEGWNYTVRLYRPRAEVLDGSWAFPSIEPA
jgi:hypothetical protein